MGYFYCILVAAILAAIVVYRIIYRYIIGSLGSTNDEERKEQKLCRTLLSKWMISSLL